MKDLTPFFFDPVFFGLIAPHHNEEKHPFSTGLASSAMQRLHHKLDPQCTAHSAKGIKARLRVCT